MAFAVMLDPDQLYESPGRTGKLRRELRTTRNSDGKPLLVAILSDMRAVANANGTLATEVAALDTLLATFAVPASLNKVVETYGPI